jgi:hypothetical protein
MTSTAFFSIYMGLRMTDSATTKAFMIILGIFRTSFEILPITFVRRRHLRWFFLL